MALLSPAKNAAYTRLKNNLRAGHGFFTDLWQYEVKDWVTGVHAADINQDGDTEVLAGSRDGRVYALTRDGHWLWDNVVGDKSWVTAVVAFPVLPDQPVACAIGTRSGRIYALDQTGQEIPPPGAGPSDSGYWFSIDQPVNQICIDPSRPLTVIFSADNHCIYCLNLLTNELLWTFDAGTKVRDIYCCDLDGDGLAEVLVGGDNHLLSLLSNAGEYRASYRMEHAVYKLYAADIDADGSIEVLASTRTKKLFAFRLDFTHGKLDLLQKWEFTLSSRPVAITVADVNDDQQPEVLVACDDRSLTILDAVGKQAWRQRLGNKRFYSLNAFDLDRNNRVELLAGADDSKVYAVRIQLTKGLDVKIRRDYNMLGKPEITTLLELDNDQLNLLLNVLDQTYGAIDRKLSFAGARALMESGDTTAALLALLKLERQRFQLLWEKEDMGYRRALCLLDTGNEQPGRVVVSSRDGGIIAFNSRGRPLWSEKSPDGGEIIDAQSGYLSAERGEELTFVSANGALSIYNTNDTSLDKNLCFFESASCFYVFAPGNPTASEILIGMNNGQAHLYTSDFKNIAQTFELAAPIDRVYISEPDGSGTYRNPELLISTSENQLFAYTRGGNRLWSYPTKSQIRALCVKDLDGDGRLEVLIGLDDRNIYVLDDSGVLRWRYVLYHSVLALETADLNGDGKQEILAGCADGILYVFTSTGDLIWRYPSKDRIQALRVADIDRDGSFEIVMVEEGHLEVLRVVKQRELDELIGICWERLLAHQTPVEALLPLARGVDPHLRAAALLKLARLAPRAPETFQMLTESVADAFTDVRKILPEALMLVYDVDRPSAHTLLSTLFRDRQRDVSIEVVEHLEVLARVDWSATLEYLERALHSNDRNTRRAALRKISHLLRDYVSEIRSSRETLGEELFNLLLLGAQDKVAHVSRWVKEEAGRVLADFLNLFEDQFLPYFYRMLAARLSEDTLLYVVANLATTPVRRAVRCLVEMSFKFDQKQGYALLLRAASFLNQVKILGEETGRPYVDVTDLWVIMGELEKLYAPDYLAALAACDFSLKPEHFLHTYSLVPAFLNVGAHVNMVTSPIKTYVRRNDPVDQLRYLLDSINSLETLRRVVDREYGASSVRGTPQPLWPEYIVLSALIERWQELFSEQRNKLRGHADLVADLQSRVVRWEDSVCIWLQIVNQGRAQAQDVKVTLLADESFVRQTSLAFVANSLQIGQERVAEFVIQPRNVPVANLSFEITYHDSENDVSKLYTEQVEFVKSYQPYTLIENPYLLGSPIQDRRMFYGREYDLTFLQDNLVRTSGQTVLVLYGQRRSGKTTLLNQLANTDILAKHVAVKIDLQSMSLNFTLNNFFFRTSYEISRALLKKGLAISTPQMQDFTGPLADPQFSFERFLDSAHEALGERKLILLFDEFEELEKHVAQGHLPPEIFTYLRSLVQERHAFHFLLSGTHTIRELTRAYWSIFFNSALHYRLPSNISARGAVELITKPTPNLEYEPLAIKKIRSLTADQPYLINIVCHKLVFHCNELRKNYVTINDVNLVLKNVLVEGDIHFDWLWVEKLKTYVQKLLLLVIAEGSKDEGRHLDLDDIYALFEKYGVSHYRDEISRALNTLVTEDVIEAVEVERREDSVEYARYTLANGLLRHWLRTSKSLSTLLQGLDEQVAEQEIELEQPAETTENRPQADHAASNGAGSDEQLVETNRVSSQFHAPDV